MFSIRKAVVNDALFLHEHFVVQQKKYNDIEYFKGILEKYMLSPEYIILILLHEDDTKIGAIVATIAQGLSERRKQANITDFFVLPKYRKLKGADFLYTQFEKELANLEVFSVKVSCEIKSTLNQNFYASKGFKFDKKLYLKNF